MKTMRWTSVLLFGLVSGFLVRPAIAATDGTLYNYNTQTANAHQWLNGVKASAPKSSRGAVPVITRSPLTVTRLTLPPKRR